MLGTKVAKEYRSLTGGERESLVVRRGEITASLAWIDGLMEWSPVGQE